MIDNNIYYNNQHNIKLISNTFNKKEIINNIYPKLTIDIISHNIHSNYKNENIKNYLLQRNISKINSVQLEDNIIYMSISYLNIAHGNVLNKNDIFNVEHLKLISGKKYKIYSLVTVYKNQKLYSKLSYEIYTNTYHRSVELLFRQYDSKTLVEYILPRRYSSTGSLERSIWCLLKNLLQ